MTNKEISEWVEKDADAWSIDASALVAILIDFVQDNNLSKAEAKNLPIDVVSDIEEDEDTEFCPKCNSADIYCEGGEFNEWHCEGCGKCFSEPNVK